MSKKLAIKGHPTRGKEVIELLKMMGARHFVLDGTNDWYVINDLDNYITFYDHNYINCHEYVKFTLEEFLEKYPFKVGDKVVYTKFGDNCNDYPVTIESMKWTGTTIEYTFNDCVTCLAKDLKMWNGEPDTVISGIYLNSCDYADEVELNLGDYKIEVRDGRTFAVKKKPKYPKTYDECKEIVGYTFAIVRDSYKLNLFRAFYRLLICRDAYWKIAGDEMGLGKPWKPDWNDQNINKYCLATHCNMIVQHTNQVNSRVFSFPTSDMRDAFYENFKDLIEMCKELL